MEPTVVVEPFVPPFAPNPNGRRYTIEELLHLGNNLPIITCFINAFKPPAFEFGIFRPDGSKGRVASAKSPNRKNSYIMNLQALPVPGRWNYPTRELIEAEGKPYQEEDLLRMLSDDARSAWNAGKLHGPKSGEQTHTAFKSIGNASKGNRTTGNSANGSFASGPLGQSTKTGAYNTPPPRNLISSKDLHSEHFLKTASTPSSILITNGRRDPKNANVSFAVPTPANTPMATPMKSDARSSMIGSGGNIMASPTSRLIPGQIPHRNGQPNPILLVSNGGLGRLPSTIPMAPVMQPLQNHGNNRMPQPSNVPSYYSRASVNQMDNGSKADYNSKTFPPIDTKSHEPHPLEARGNGQQSHQASSEAHSVQQSPAARGSAHVHGAGTIGRSPACETPSLRKVPGLFGRSYIPGIAQRQQDPFKQQGLYTPINRPEQDWQHQANLYGLTEELRPQQPQRQPAPSEAPIAVSGSSQQIEEPVPIVSSPAQTPTRVGSGSSYASSNLARSSNKATVPVEIPEGRLKNSEIAVVSVPASVTSNQKQQEIVRQRLAMHQQRIQQIQEAQRAERQEQDLLAMQLRRHHLIQQQQVEQMSRIQQQQLLLQQQQMAEQQRLHQLMYAQFMAGVNQGQVPVKDVSHPNQVRPAAVQHSIAMPQVASLSFSDQLRRQAEEFANNGKHSRKAGKVKHY